MAYLEINRSTPNDEQGDDAREWAGKTNENMKELFSRSFVRSQYIVTRWVYDPAALNFTGWANGDKIEGWAVSNTRWVSALLLDTTGINLPTDLDDPAKVLLLIDKTIIT
jgi:hypothetical protein